MRYQLSIHAGVHDEVVDAVAYYHEQQPGLGEELHEEWEKAIERIVQTPEGYQEKRKHFRQALLQRFPYMIIFTVKGSEIVVYRFINIRRHPAKRYAKRKK